MNCYGLAYKKINTRLFFFRGNLLRWITYAEALLFIAVDETCKMCVLSLGLSFPRPFDDNSHDGMKGETKLVRVFFFFAAFLSGSPVFPLGPLLGPERSLFGGKFSYVGGYGEKGIRNGELGACEKFLSEFARDAPTRRRSHARLKALFGASP